MSFGILPNQAVLVNTEENLKNMASLNPSENMYVYKDI